MLKINKALIHHNYAADNQNTLKMWQGKMTKNNDTLKESSLIPVESIITIQHEHKAPQIHGTVMEQTDANHTEISHKIILAMTSKLIIYAKHIKPTST